MQLKWQKILDYIEVSLFFKLIILFILILNVNIVYSFYSIAFFPLQNNLKDKKLYWLARGISEALRDSIYSSENYILTSEQMNEIYDHMGLSENMDLTYATIIKMASLNNIDYALIGSLENNENDEKALLLKARIVDIKTLNSYKINIESELDNVINLQIKLSEAVVNYFNSKGLKMSYYKDLFNNISAFSFEMYIKGLQEEQPEKKIKFFKQAIKENKSFPIVNLKLAKAYYQLEDYNKAIETLSEISSDSSLFHIALFEKANLLAAKKDFSTALQDYLEVSKHEVSSSLFNNIAVALINQNNLQHAQWYLKQALSIYPEDSDLTFNQAILFILMDNLQQAKENAILFLTNNPRNLMGHLIMYYIAEKTGNQDFANFIKEIAEKYGKFSIAKEKFKGDFKELSKLQSNFSEELLKKYKKNQNKDTAISVISAISGYKARIKESIDRKEYSQCIEDIEKATLLSPYDWEIHYLRAKIYLATNDINKAEFFVKLSLWCKETNEALQLLNNIKSPS